MSRPRYNQTPVQKRTPKTPHEWAALMAATIERAERSGSNHLQGLRHAQANGQAEAFLRRIGVIHSGDIDREFPQ